jgi:hypothetical protein
MLGALVILATRKHKWEDCGPGWPGHKSETLFERKQAKKAGGVPQVLEHLPNKSEALSSNSCYSPNKKYICYYF